MGDMESPCKVCVSPAKLLCEQAYMNGEWEPIRRAGFSRVAIERHMAHLTDAQTLRQVTTLASASAVAARLRQLELAGNALIDEALTPKVGRRLYKGAPVVDEHGKPIEEIDTGQAIMALREVRAIHAEMSRIAGHLTERVDADEGRPDIDAMLQGHLGGSSSAATQADDQASGLPELMAGIDQSAPV